MSLSSCPVVAGCTIFRDVSNPICLRLWTGRDNPSTNKYYKVKTFWKSTSEQFTCLHGKTNTIASRNLIAARLARPLDDPYQITTVNLDYNPSTRRGCCYYSQWLKTRTISFLFLNLSTNKISLLCSIRANCIISIKITPNIYLLSI